MNIKAQKDMPQSTNTMSINDHCIDIKNVLIIEDQKFLLEHIQKSMTETLPINCDIAETESEANVLLEKNSYDLIIMDIYLPDSSGNFIGYLIRKNCRMILITARDTEENRDKLVSLPIVDYVFKTDQKTLVNYLIEATHRLIKNKDTIVAVCDDSKLARLKIIDILKTQNLAYLEFSDGQEAYHCIVEQQLKLNLLITDLHMPNMDGAELIRHIRHSIPKYDFPILAFSSSEKKSTVSQLLKLGANDYINKPINNEEFLTRLNSTLEQYRLYHQNSKLIEQLQKTVSTDFLTELYNRTFFYNAFKHVFAQAKRDKYNYGIVMIDIDRFKKVNDTYGHEAGDVTLKIVSKLIKNNQRDSDIVCRWGGEEFLILVQKTTLTQIVQFAERLRTTIENTPVIITPTLLEFSVTTSFGVAIGTEKDVDSIIRKADECLYKAKNSGRNKVVFK